MRRAMVLPLVLVMLLAGCSDGDDAAPASSASQERQDEVAERGAEVMPFDLDATTHTFTDTEEGGVQIVEADDPADAEQIELIRAHLLAERGRFARGDFSDPTAIHGTEMPGLEALVEGHALIVVTYRELPAGAELRYTTEDEQLRQALHEWFDAQLMDHGDHASAH